MSNVSSHKTKRHRDLQRQWRMFHRWLVIPRLVKMCPLHTYTCVFVNHIPQLKKKKEKNENSAVFSNMSPESGRGGGTKTQEWARVTHHIFTPICALKSLSSAPLKLLKSG